MYRATKLFFVGALGAAALSAPAFAETVYDQPGTTAACAGACWTSSFGDGVGFQAYDDFSLTADANVTGATWRGFIQGPDSNGPVDPAIQDWTISFSADNSGAPGSVLYSHTFAAADVSTTFLGDSTFNGTVHVYEFHVDLPGGFAATAGTTYWFSPFATQEHFYPFFSWSPAAAQTGGTTYQIFRPNGDTFVRPGDRAFSLQAGVPEPATWAVMLVGLGGAGAMLRRRRALLAA